jgi:hypothetical protein
VPRRDQRQGVTQSEFVAPTEAIEQGRPVISPGFGIDSLLTALGPYAESDGRDRPRRLTRVGAGQPPATAGRMWTVLPSSTGVVNSAGCPST